MYRLRGASITWLLFLCILLPHAIVFSTDPYMLARSLLLAAFAFPITGLVATQLNYLERQLEAYREILSLSEELHDYIERLESTQRQLIQAEKMNALGQLSASIAHEINNPLAGVLVYTKLLSKKVGGDSFDKQDVMANLSKIESAVSHCSTLVRGLLDFARQTAPVLQRVTVSDVISNVMMVVGHQAQMSHVEVTEEEASPSLDVLADPHQLQQVLTNLVINAIQAMPDGGKLTIRTAADEDGQVSVSVADTGCGIAPENMDKLFTPFFTTKEEVKGVGLGLAVSHGIVERHGGRIEVQSEVGKGTTFTVHLPAYGGGQDRPTTPQP